ncbi:MAG TPA: DUF5686 family protein [Saprospiraceae bacterium]|nr:DUF5686 family protein [Saprospiraceae bacterium]
MTRLRLLAPLLCSLLLLVASMLSAQSTFVVSGQVKDAATGEPVEMATVRMIGTGGGAITDSTGHFSFKIAEPGDSLTVSQIGYLSITLPVNRQRLTGIEVRMQGNSFMLGEAVISADPNPGKALIKKVLTHNGDNNPARFGRLDARRWTRAEVAALDPKAAADASGKTIPRGGIFGSRVRAFEQVRPADDTLRGQTPLFFVEKLARYTLGNHPFMENERVFAVKTTGLESDKLLEPLARWDAGNVNLYDAWVALFSKTFVSPIGTEALGFYDYYIQDTLNLPNGYHHITLQVIPKVWQGNVFTGMISVEDSAYALVGAELRLSKDANLNYIESLSLHQEFAPALDLATGQTVQVPRVSTLTIRYEAGLDLLGVPLPANADSKRLISRMTAVFDSVRVNDPAAATVATGGIVTATRSHDTGASDDFWQKSRPDSLSSHETAIYQMADNLRNDPRQRFKDKFFSTFGTGFYYFGDKAFIGPLGTLASFNRIEGTRFRVGFRTMEGTFKKTGVYGHLAYGTRDQRFKGSLGVKHLWGTKPYAKTELFAGSDYNAISQWYDEIDKDGFINSLLRKNVPYYQTFQRQMTLTHDQQIGANWFLRGGMAYRTISPSFDFNYPNPEFRGAELTPNEPATAQSIPVAEASLALRFAWHERSRIYDYERISTGSKYPSVALIYTRGFRFADADFGYQKINIDISHTTRLTPKAALIWNLDAGKIFGTLPSLLLQVPRGNDAYVMSRYVFNTMQPYEFAADRYASLQTRLSLGGMLFDRVPFLQKLGWRERLTFNAFWGDINPANRSFNTTQHLAAPNGNPFMEAGVGVENIFHLFSIDYVQRLNYLDSPGAAGNRSGIYLGMKVVF